ncbi:alpha/beta-Hydrolases superfamily protein, partial [Striga asiatica]
VKLLEGPLGLPLQVLEKIQLSRRPIFCKVVAVSVRPFQDSPALDHLLPSLHHEPQPVLSLLLSFKKPLHVGQGNPPRLVVRSPPLVIMHVPFKIPGLGEASVLHRRAVVVTVASLMVSKRLEAKPTELEMARRPASHHVAALVLLYGPPALWARLRVRLYPLYVLCLRSVFLSPLPHRPAVHRAVDLIPAPEAHPVAAPTPHLARTPASLNLDRQLAPGGRAPPPLPRAALHVPVVLGPLVRAGQGVNKVRAYLGFASGLGAGQGQAARPGLDRCADVAPPALGAEAVVAVPGRHHRRRVAGFEADLTQPGLFGPGRFWGGPGVVVAEPFVVEGAGRPVALVEESAGDATGDGEDSADVGDVRVLDFTNLMFGEDFAALIVAIGGGVVLELVWVVVFEYCFFTVAGVEIVFFGAHV